MNLSQKITNTQFARLMLYRRPLHPELFELEERRIDRHGEYEIESWIAPATHVVRFQLGRASLVEVVCFHSDHLPEAGLVHALPAFGEKDFDLEHPENNIGYVTTLQTETLTDNLYQATFREMRDFARETGAIAHEWADEDGALNMSILDGQKYRREYHFQGYHLIANGGFILRTQSIFEHVK